MNATSIPNAPVSLRDATDDALVALARTGSRPAAGELYRRHAPAVRRSVTSRVSRDDAEDITQDVFLVLLTDPRFTPAPGRLGPWLRGIANRLAAKRRAQLVQESLLDGEKLLCDDPWREPEELDEESSVGVHD
jgi:DNA-directed RNA polymerase specialized sigma24 family protein